jgi:hypothetical protein
MKDFMVFVWILIFGAAMTGCTTFSYNESGLRRACKSGVKSYSDDTVTFECKDNSLKSYGKAHIGD